jgi:chromosome segregation ATPase
VSRDTSRPRPLNLARFINQRTRLIGLVAVLAPVLVASSVWQASGSTRRNKQLQSLQSTLDGIRKETAETEQRIARLGDCFTTLDAIRRQFGELEEHRAHLERAIAEVETDASGRSLADRQNELHEFTAQTRVRVRVLQDSSTALNGFRQDMEKAQAALVPLQAKNDGLEARIAELRERRDRLIRTIEKIESQGEEKLSARVEALYRSKVETEQSILAIVAHFSKLDTIRKEVNDLFVKLNGTLDRLG